MSPPFHSTYPYTYGSELHPVEYMDVFVCFRSTSPILNSYLLIDPILFFCFLIFLIIALLSVSSYVVFSSMLRYFLFVCQHSSVLSAIKNGMGFASSAFTVDKDSLEVRLSVKSIPSQFHSFRMEYVKT